jgi:hypothetical protein
MRKSEIFENFVKIAQEKGMISNDSSEAFKKLQTTHRADSQDISTIEALYGTKPNTSKDMEYERNIMEVAHPNSVVVSPSYDKLNGLVENEIERQNINLHIVYKTPDGLSTQRKYARKELLLSLVRIGNDLDNRDKERLYALADTCLVQLNEQDQLKKEAVGPLVIVLIAAATIGAIYAHQHLPNTNQGLEQNYKELQTQLDDFLTASVTLGVGHTYDEELKSDVQGFKDHLNEFYDAYKSLNDVIRSLEKPKDAKELMALAAQPQTQSVVKAVAQLRSLATNMASYMDQIAEDFASTSYKKRHTSDTGTFNSILEYTHLSGGNSSLFADNFQDVINAIPPFRSSIAELLQTLERAKSVEGKAAADLTEAAAKAKTEFGGATTNWDETSKPSTSPQDKSVKDLDNEASELSKMLSGQGLG